MLLLALSITSTSVGSVWGASETLGSVHLVNGQLVNDKGAVYLNGLNYKDQFKYQLYEKPNAPDWTGISDDFKTMASLGANTDSRLVQLDLL